MTYARYNPDAPDIPDTGTQDAFTKCTCTQPTCEHCGEFSETGRVRGPDWGLIIGMALAACVWVALIWLVLS